MKYRHFPAAALAAGLLFCTLFSGLTAYADDKKSELTQKQTETQQEYEAAQSWKNCKTNRRRPRARLPP